MRTIKFRAQDVASNKWLYGDLRRHENDFCIFEHGGTNGEQVKRETIGQFTGLTDIDGREIYEGDVLHFDGLNYRMVFIYNTGEFAALKIEHSMLNPPVNYRVVSFWCKKGLKIIGNIYDNPELIAEDMNKTMPKVIK